MIYCGRKSDLMKFKRIYLPKDFIIEFNDDGSDKYVKLKTGRENYSDIYPNLPYVTCECCSKNKYIYTSKEKKDKWIIKHNLKGRPIIQLYDTQDNIIITYSNGNKIPFEGHRTDMLPQIIENKTEIIDDKEITIETTYNPEIVEHDKKDNHINGEIHYIDINTIEVTFSEPVAGYAICLLVTDRSMVYYGEGTEWYIEHNLGDKPFTQVFNSLGFLINGEIQHIDDNITKITFSQNIKGYAVLISEPDADYVHTQTTPASEWVIKHRLGEKCLVQLVEPSLYVMLSDIRHVNDNEARIYFTKPVSGEAICVAGYSKNSKRSEFGGVIVVDQYDLPDVAEARLNTLYVLKPSGYSYITNDNFQWIAINVGPDRIDGNNFNKNAPITDGNRQNDNQMIIDERNID